MSVDPVLAVVGDRASRAVYDKARLAMGLDRSVPEQYFLYLKKLLSGDFGNSVITSHSVLTDVMHFFPATFELATIATILGVVIGVPVGVAAGAQKGRWPDHLVRVIGLFGYSIPVFWLGLVGLFVFYGNLGWVGGPGRIDVAYDDIVTARTGIILIDSAIEGGVGYFLECLQPYHSAGQHSRLLFAGLYRPHDPEFHDRAAQPGICDGGPHQGAFLLGCGMGPRIPQYHGAADYRYRSQLRLAA